jgi:hypothetical protein
MTSVRIPFPTNDDDESGEDLQNTASDVTVSRRGFAGNATGTSVEFYAVEPTVDVGALQAFETEEEMIEAATAKLPDGSTRMHVDPQYRAEVEARMALSMGFVRAGLNQTPVFKGRIGSDQRRNQMSGLLIDVPQPEDVFESIEEVIAAMSDQRYAADPKYRRSVDSKVGRSSL